MFILFGTRGITSTADEGTFHCPECEGKQDYKLKRVRRFFTLFFIPLIPLDKLGEYVECNNCGSTYNTKILNYDPEAEAKALYAQYFEVSKLVMIKMMLADGEIDEKEIAQMQNHIKELFDVYVDRASIGEEIENVKQLENVDKTIDNMVSQLNINDKEKIMQAALAIAFADGNFDEDERNEISALGQSLALSPAHVKGLIAETEEKHA